jgi:flagellar FliL protein
MAIASMVCGIVGIIGFISSWFRIWYLNDLKGKVGLIFQLQIQEQLTTAITFAIISFILILLAFIFGIIERKKGKSYKYYGMAMAGFILGLIGIILPIVPIIFVTGTVITYNIYNKGRQEIVITDTTSPYIGRVPQYSFFDGIGSITTRTNDLQKASSVTVEMLIGYDLNDQKALNELNTRRIELVDFTKRYFSGKSIDELSPENEEILKSEIREQLNTRFLDTARVRIILFNRLDVMEDY